MPLLLACAEPAVEDPAAWFARADADVFRGDVGRGRHVAFDAVASDMDLDGDPDLLISWHHMGPLELFENRDGGFLRVAASRLGAAGGDASGLQDAPGVPYLFAETDAIERRILAGTEAGLYLWHEADRQGSWRILWHDPEARSRGFVLELDASRGFSEIEGPDAGAIERRGERGLTILGGDGERTQRFRVKTEALTSRLALRLRAPVGGARPRLFVGQDLTPIAGGSVELWKPDPHGIAWVDVADSPHPELYVTRGGLAGFLRPPLVGKRDRFFLHRGGARPLYRLAAPGVVPRDHRRGRQVEWIDLGGDGSLALSVTGKGSPNGLLLRDRKTGVLRDVAKRHGLAFPGAEVASWGDLDEDGLPDLFFLGADAIDVALHRGRGRRFRRVPGADLKLQLPAHAPGEPSLFETASLRLADFDNDGRLDLWLLSHGPRRTNHLFLRRGDVFEESSERAGLAELSGNQVVVLLDADNDSFMDAVAFGPERAVLWRNRRGRRFEPAVLAAELVPEVIHAAVAADFDGDGATDLVLAGHERHLLRNRAGSGNGSLDVSLRQAAGEPVGALVRASYSDGSAVAQRYGSMRSSGFSQSLQPLHFGIPAGVTLQRIAVRWPGRADDELYDVADAGGRVELERGSGRAQTP